MTPQDLLIELAELAKKMPGGLPDDDAARKLAAEIDEMYEAQEYGDRFAEACDVAYYYAKLHAMGLSDRYSNIPSMLEAITGASFIDILVGAVAKYEYRASGGKKDPTHEKELIRSAIRRSYGYRD